MDYKKAINILKKLPDKHRFSVQEKKAVWTAIGTLDWALIAQKNMRNRIKILKVKRDKSIEP